MACQAGEGIDQEMAAVKVGQHVGDQGFASFPCTSANEHMALLITATQIVDVIPIQIIPARLAQVGPKFAYRG